MTTAAVRVERRRGAAAVILRAGELEASFVPELNLLGTSLRLDGEEFLALPGGIAGYRRGHTTGLPLLAPWANRLSAPPGRRFVALEPMTAVTNALVERTCRVVAPGERYTARFRVRPERLF